MGSVWYFAHLYVSNISASRIPSVFTAISGSSAKAIALVCFLNSKIRKELNWIFQNPSPQDLCGQPLLTSLSTCKVFVLITAVLWLKQILVRLYKFLGQLKSFRVISMFGHHAASKAPLTWKLTSIVINPSRSPSSTHTLYVIAASVVLFWGVNPNWSWFRRLFV